MAFNCRDTIRQRVIDYLDGRTDIDTKTNQWIDDTRRDLAGKYAFNYLYVEATASTSASIARYALPSDYNGHLNIFIGSKKLIRLLPNEFDSIHGDTIAIETTDNAPITLFTTSGMETGESDYYIDRGMEFDLWPIPDATYILTLKYYANPIDWTLDTDYDYISTFHTEAIIFGAALRGAIYLEDDAKKAEYKEEYKEQIGMMLKSEKDRKSSDVVVRMKSYKDFGVEQFKRMMKVNN
jgi:hypothetical protein